MTGTRNKSHRNKRRKTNYPEIESLEKMTESIGRAAVGVSTIGLATAVIGRI